MIAFEVPGEPVPIARMMGKPGSTFYPHKPAKQVAYGNLVKMISAERMLIAGLSPFEGAVSVTVRAQYVVPKSWPAKKKAAAVWKTSKPDGDNILKIVKDAMKGIVYVDDALVADLRIQKKYGPRQMLVVEVAPL